MAARIRTLGPAEFVAPQPAVSLDLKSFGISRLLCFPKAAPIYFHVEDAILEPKPVQKPRPASPLARGSFFLQRSRPSAEARVERHRCLTSIADRALNLCEMRAVKSCRCCRSTRRAAASPVGPAGSLRGRRRAVRRGRRARAAGVRFPSAARSEPHAPDRFPRAALTQPRVLPRAESAVGGNGSRNAAPL